ncbi:pyridoxal-phosphate dependent enzyme [bacterium]|nr:pyridoxal-phosphate dependent enzyme [bacterium]
MVPIIQQYNIPNPETFYQAALRISPHITTTPCPLSRLLSDATGAKIFLKLENRQTSGSFKIRGVANKILSLNTSERSGKLIAASTGNHGAAFAHIISEFQLNGELFIPVGITSVKHKAIQKYGIPLISCGDDCVETESAARIAAKSDNSIFISPYNDIDIIIGQGTIGIELLDQIDRLDVVIIPIGGGGLISGIAAFLKQVKPAIQIIGCQPANSPVMAKSVKAGHIVSMHSLPTLSDATAGGIEPNAITFNICRDLVDKYVILDEDEIFSALRHLHLKENVIAEGGSAMTVAAVKKLGDELKGKGVALIISGGKIDPEIIRKIGDSNAKLDRA